MLLGATGHHGALPYSRPNLAWQQTWQNKELYFLMGCRLRSRDSTSLAMARESGYACFPLLVSFGWCVQRWSNSSRSWHVLATNLCWNHVCRCWGCLPLHRHPHPTMVARCLHFSIKLTHHNERVLYYISICFTSFKATEKRLQQNLSPLHIIRSSKENVSDFPWAKKWGT